MRSLLIVFLLYGGGMLFSQSPTLALPDMVAPKRARPDVELPSAFPVPGTDWYPEAPGYRRVYPDTALNTFMPLSLSPAPQPKDFRVADNAVEPDYLVEAPTQPVFREKTWLIESSTDFREGTETLVFRELGDFGYLGAGFYLPFDFSSEAVRPYSGHLDWRQDGALSSDAVLMMKGSSSGGFLPLATVSASLLPGMDRYDEYSLDFLALDSPDKKGAAVLQLGSSFQIPMFSSVSLVLKVDAGAWKESDYGGLGRVATAIRWTPLRIPMDFSAGVDLSYDSFDELNTAPYYKIDWHLSPNWTVYSEGGLNVGFSSEGVKALEQEAIDSFNPVLPLYSSYRIGWTALLASGGLLEGSRFTGDFAYFEGRFNLADSQHTMQLVSDRRWKANLGLNIAFPNASLAFDGGILWRFDFEPLIWESYLSYRRLSWEVFTAAGSEDALLGTGLPGVRTNAPIIMLGSRIIATPAWEFSVSGYCGVSFDNPSLRLKIRWSDVCVN